MGMGSGSTTGSIFDIFRRQQEEESRLTPEEIARLRAEGNTPLGQAPQRDMPVYEQPTQTSDFANPIPQYQPSRFDPNPYAAAYQQQFGQNMQQLGQNLPPVQSPQIPGQQVGGLGALAQMYGMYNAAPTDAASQDAHAASIAAAANTTI